MSIFYVDSVTGDDGDTGLTEALAWKTLAKVNASSFAAGDSILFKCGETWKGEHLTVPSDGGAGNVITFGTYGTGDNPLIDPTTQIADFTLDSGAIWQRSDTNDIQQVFEDDVRMIYSADKAGMVQGSYAKVAGTPGTLYVWCTDSGNPNTGHVIDVVLSANNRAVALNGKSFLIFDGIDVIKANVVAYNTSAVGTSNVIIRNCTCSWTGIRSFLIGTAGGVEAMNPSDVTISNCVAHDDISVAFWIGRGSRLIIENCEAYNAGADVSPNGKLYPGSGASAEGILISGDGIDCIVRDNYVHDIYLGPGIIDELSVGLHSSGTIIERNLIDVSTTSVYGMSIEGINTRVSYNIIRTGTGTGIMLDNGPTVPLIYNNVIISPSGAGHCINTNSQPGAVIKNNIMVRSGTTNRFISVAAGAQAGFVADHNCYYQASGTARWFWGPTEYTTFATWKAASGQDANSLNEDPKFVTPYTDLHLQSDSPCINAGVDVGLTEDFEGNDIW